MNGGVDTCKGNPMKEEIQVFCMPGPDKRCYQAVKFTMNELKHVNMDNGNYVFVNGENCVWC